MKIAEANSAWRLVAPQDSRSVSDVERLSGGVSNMTYILSLSDGEEAILRTPPPGKRSGNAHNMVREAKVLSAVHPVFPQAPHIVGWSEDSSATGDQFLIMGFIDGTPLPPGTDIALTPDQARALSENFVSLLVDLHEADVTEAVLEAFGDPDGFVQRQVAGWTRRFEKIGMHNPRERLVNWLAANVPPQSRDVAILHNDYKLDNMILDPQDPTRILGVLDWELSGLGDPFMDIGNALAYWIEAGDNAALQAFKRGPTDLPGMMTRDEIINAYCARRGIERPDSMTFYLAMGLFRLSVIAIQIHMRLHKSVDTPSPFLSATNALLDRAEDVIEG